MAFKIGDKVEVYRRQAREEVEVVEKGYKGKIVGIIDPPFYGKWAAVEQSKGDWVAVKFTYLKHIKE